MNEHKHKLVHLSVVLSFSCTTGKKRHQNLLLLLDVNTEEIWSVSFTAEFMRFQIVTEEFNIVLQIYVKPQGCHFGMKAYTIATGLRWQAASSVAQRQGWAVKFVNRQFSGG